MNENPTSDSPGSVSPGPLDPTVPMVQHAPASAPSASSEDPTLVTAPPTRPSWEAPGDAIGTYQLIEPLGEGGFGTVWRAEQQEPIHREVALKVIKLGMDSREIIARFEAERQALALMDHPNIAAVLDAGTTESGRPYFAMELVKGVPITEYCDAKKLSIRQRLELFIPVCQAVQHAHQKAILHRDLKPGNILVMEVDGKPVPKVIDFGIAKALGTSGEAAFNATLARTVDGLIVGTPQYMSPEQADARGDIDTRSDIYTLGVILYELLTGAPPLPRERLRQAAADEVLRLVREAEAKRPSSCLTPVTEATGKTAAARMSEPGRLTRALRGDLDWIALKALEKERERRYGSAAALAKDLERHLKDEPVEAGPPSAAYRVRKFVRRNQLAVGAAAALLALLVAGIAVSTWQMLRAQQAESLAEEQRKRADEEAAVATAVNAFLRNDLLRQAGSRAQADQKYEAEPELTVRRALHRAAERMGTRFKDQPLIEAAIRQTIGDAYDDLGEATKAVEQLTQALDLRMAKLGPEHPDTLTTMNNLAGAYLDAGKLDQALPLYEKTIELKKATLGPEHPDTLTSIGNLAICYQGAGKLDEALPLYEDTLRLRQTKLGPEHPDTLTSIGNLAVAYQDAGKLGQALPLYEESFKLSQTKLGPEHPETLISMGNLAVAYQDAGKLGQALPLFEEALRLKKATLGPEHPSTLISMGSLAGAYQDAGKLDLALPLYEESFKLSQDRLGPDHPDTLVSMGNLAVAYRFAGKLDQALPLLKETLRLRQATLGLEHPSTLISMGSLAGAYQEAGKLDQALPLLKETLKLHQAKLGPEHPDTLTTMNNLAAAYQDAGKLDQALPLYEEALKLSQAKCGPDHPDTLIAMNNLAGAYRDVGKRDQALPLYEETLRLRQTKLGPEHPDTLISTNNLAVAYQDAGKLGQALPLFEEALKLNQATLGPEHPGTLLSMNNLAAAYRDVGKRDQALPLFEETLRLRQARLGPEHPDTLMSAAGLGVAYTRTKRHADAEPLFLEAHDGLSRQKDRLSATERDWLRLCIKELAALYAAAGKPEQAAIWRQKLEELQSSGPKPPPAPDPPPSAK